MSPSRLRVYFNEFLEHCAKPEQRTNELTPEAKRAIVEEIHADVFAYPHWQEVLGQCGLHPLEVAWASIPMPVRRRGRFAAAGRTKGRAKSTEC